MDLVLRGGPVLTCDAAGTRASAVAVHAGRVVAVGHDDAVAGLIGQRTEVVDLDGRLLLPGFQDAHVHTVWGGLDLMRCDLAPLSTREAYLERIAGYAAEHPDDPWLLGGGWQMSAFPGGTPRASELDAVVGDRPAFLPNRDGHGAWVSSRALALAGIDRTTPDPPDGRIERDPDGTPTGTLHEGAMTLVNRLLPVTSDEDMLRALQLGQEYLHSVGVTAWQDAIIGGYGDAGDAGPAYVHAIERGLLTGRVVGALWWDRNRGLEQIDELVELRESYRAAGFAATSVKIMQDGIVENGTAAMLEPYLDVAGARTSNSGISFVAPELLDRAVTRLDALGFQVHVHAIGDRAVREALDAFEAALRTNGRSDNRHHIAHLQVVHPDDVPRFRELGVTATMQSLWAVLEPQMVDLALPFLGEPRASRQYPWGDLRRSGAVLAAGSDWSVSTPDPWAAIHAAVNRRAHRDHAEGDYPAFLPEQRLDLATAITAYTAGSAWVNHLEGTGTIRVGARADLVVVDRDPFAGPAEEIGSTRTLQTFVEGVCVWKETDA
ncbi:amidohydrolase [Actinotalea sp.]|uniref:amidohydrolase n=1 Tax=Actinotalea sp. TaxID=1872145 RepID=UPI00356A33EF